MTPEEQYDKSIEKVFDILMTGPNADQHTANFNTPSAGKKIIMHSLVEAKLLPSMPPGSGIVLSHQVYKTLNLLQKHTRERDNEHKFFLAGKSENNIIIFDDVRVEVGDNKHTTRLRDADALTRFIRNAQSRNPNEHVVICNGHTHRDWGKDNHNFSFMDLVTYVDAKETAPDFRTGKIGLVMCVMISGNYNFLFYDEATNNFYKFRNVQYITKYNQLKPLPAYTEKQNIGFFKRYFEKD
jgi:hypothetical protein